MQSTMTARSPFFPGDAEDPRAERLSEGDLRQKLNLGVVIVDQSAHGKILVQGDAADSVIGEAFRVADLAVGCGVALEAEGVYRLRHDLYYVSTTPRAAGDAGARLRARVTASGDFVTLTDITHGRSELLLQGAASAALISKLCSLDCSDRAFPDGAVKQTSFAKTKQMIIRRDESGVPAFAVIGGRSCATYLWEITVEAGAEFGVTQIGANALRAWRESAST